MLGAVINLAGTVPPHGGHCPTAQQHCVSAYTTMTASSHQGQSGGSWASVRGTLPAPSMHLCTYLDCDSSLTFILQGQNKRKLKLGQMVDPASFKKPCKLVLQECELTKKLDEAGVSTVQLHFDENPYCKSFNVAYNTADRALEGGKLILMRILLFDKGIEDDKEGGFVIFTLDPATPDDTNWVLHCKTRGKTYVPGVSRGPRKIPKWQKDVLPECGDKHTVGRDGRGKMLKSHTGEPSAMAYRSPHNEAMRPGVCKNADALECTRPHCKTCQVCYRLKKSRMRAKWYCKTCRIFVCSLACFRYQHGLTGATRGAKEALGQ